MPPVAQGYSVLTEDEVRKLKSIEGNGVGNGILPAKVDTAMVGAAAATAAGTAAAAAATAAATAAAAAATAATAAAAAQTTANTAVTNAAAAQATANLAVPKLKVVNYAVAVPAGSATPAAIAVAGLLAADQVLGLTQKVANANSLTPIAYSVADGLLTVVYSADPGASGVLNLAVLHA